MWNGNGWKTTCRPETPSLPDGPGEFTSNGHFIVLTGLQNGRLKINDPNSRKNSEKTWDIDQVLEQTKAVWVYYK
ncbi:hypothetical protein DXB02_12460 [Blautia sp. OF11-22]|nr:papain-like cysteine protease family protein [Blautia sp. OF11-22]RHV77641.1 hypothetical protein DXB02_12460 [Blautia sp. OF11-22]